MCRSSGGSVASMETADSPKGGGRRYFLTHEKMIKKRWANTNRFGRNPQVGDITGSSGAFISIADFF